MDIENLIKSLDVKTYKLCNASFYELSNRCAEDGVFAHFPESRLESTVRRMGFVPDSRASKYNHMLPAQEYEFSVQYAGSTVKTPCVGFNGYTTKIQAVGAYFLLRTHLPTGKVEVVDGGVAKDWGGDSLLCDGTFGRWNLHVEKNT